MSETAPLPETAPPSGAGSPSARTMQAVVCHGPRDDRLTEGPVPGEALVRVLPVSRSQEGLDLVADPSRPVEGSLVPG